MPRTKGGIVTRRRHKKFLSMTKGQRATKKNVYRRAHDAARRSMRYAFIHRRERKGDMRRLWILRVSAAARAGGMSYSQFIFGLKESGIEVNRKILADLAVKEPESLNQLITLAKAKVQEIAA